MLKYWQRETLERYALKNHLRWIALISILFIVSLACRTFIPGNEVEHAGQTLFRDEFTDPSSGWNRISADTGETDYADGAYRIYVDQPNMDIWAKPDLSFSDVRIEVDAFKVGGDRDNRFGVICRAKERDHFYTFIISSDGYFGIGKIKGEDYQLIGMDALQYSDMIEQGSALNHLRADCVGNTLTFYINGIRIAQAQDSEFISGDVGLIAGTYNSTGTDIRFDNFIVYKP